MITHPYWWDTVSDGSRYRTNSEAGTLNPEPTRVLRRSVVGAGYTGLAASLALARSGASVVSSSASTPGGVPARATAGRCSPASGSSRQRWWQHGEAGARALFDAATASLSTLESIIRDEGIDCDYERTGHIQAAHKPAHFDAFREEQELLARVFDHAVTLVAPADQAAELGTRRYHGLLVDERSGAITLAKYVQGLVRAAARAGACVAEHTDVLRVSRSAGAWTVKTTRGDVRAGSLFIATNGYTGAATPALRRRLIPIGSYIIVTAPLAPEVQARLIPRRRMVFDSNNFLYYFRLTGDGRLLFGGRAEFTQPNADTTGGAAQILRRGLAEVFPELAGTSIDYAWGGNVAFTRDQLPHAGKLDEAFYAGGYCGHGIDDGDVSEADLIARRIARDTFDHPLIDRPFPPVPFYDGRPWFLSVVGASYRFGTWLTDTFDVAVLRRRQRRPVRGPERPEGARGVRGRRRERAESLSRRQPAATRRKTIRSMHDAPDATADRRVYRRRIRCGPGPRDRRAHERKRWPAWSCEGPPPACPAGWQRFGIRLQPPLKGTLHL